EPYRTRLTKAEAVAAVVQRLDVFLVSKVVQVQTQIDLLRQTIGSHRVSHPVRRNFRDAVAWCGARGDVALLIAEVARATTKGQITQGIGGPESSGQLWRPAHTHGFHSGGAQLIFNIHFHVGNAS